MFIKLLEQYFLYTTWQTKVATSPTIMLWDIFQLSVSTFSLKSYPHIFYCQIFGDFSCYIGVIYLPLWLDLIFAIITLFQNPCYLDAQHLASNSMSVLIFILNHYSPWSEPELHCQKRVRISAFYWEGVIGTRLTSSSEICNIGRIYEIKVFEDIAHQVLRWWSHERKK